jgi:cytochrome c oxidase subunit 4
MADEKKEISVRMLIGIFVALLALLATTVGLAQLPLGPASTVVSLAIAIVKAGLVVVFFMHLRVAKRTTWLFAGAAIIWLTLLFSLTFADYATRKWEGRTEDIATLSSPMIPPPGVTLQQPVGKPIAFERRPAANVPELPSAEQR